MSCCNPIIRYDQVIKADINVCKVSETKFRILLRKVSKVILFQVWSKCLAKDQNRTILVSDEERWLKNFCNDKRKYGTTPTAVLEVCDNFWGFVIIDAYFKNGKLVLVVDTSNILNGTGTDNNITPGCYKNARFSIDAATNGGYTAVQSSQFNSKNAAASWTSTYTSSPFYAGSYGAIYQVLNSSDWVGVVVFPPDNSQTVITGSTVFTSEEQSSLQNQAPALKFNAQGNIISD